MPSVKPKVFEAWASLKRLDAWQLVRRRCKRDHRGFAYDPKTGKAVAT